MAYIMKALIPIIIGIIVCYGMLKGVKVYECFVEGAKEGLKIALRIFPYLLAMLLAVTIFREAKALDYLLRLITPIVRLIGLPPEVAPLVFMKPLSGSGALGIFTEIIQKYGADSFIGLTASIIMGTTETIFYTISVYYGSVGIKKIRHTLWAAIMADLTAVILAVTMASLFFR